MGRGFGPKRVVCSDPTPRLPVPYGTLTTEYGSSTKTISGVVIDPVGTGVKSPAGCDHKDGGVLARGPRISISLSPLIARST